LITPELEPHVYRHLRRTAQQYEIAVHAIGGIANHVHLAVSIPPAMAVATAAARLKGASTRAIKEELGIDFGWQGDYGVTSFAERHLGPVVDYIRNQQQRHTEDSLWPEAELTPAPMRR